MASNARAAGMVLQGAKGDRYVLLDDLPLQVNLFGVQVWRAKSENSGVCHAIKIFEFEDDREAQEMCQREASMLQSIAKLRCPHLPRIQDSFVHRGPVPSFIIVTELRGGALLSNRM